jgi:hypothetical protein
MKPVLSSTGQWLAIGFCTVSIVSCSTIGSKTAYETCPVKPKEWKLLPRAPENELAIIETAAPELSDKHGLRTFWFQADLPDDLLMCRTPYFDSCGGNCGSSTSHFCKVDGVWKLVDGGVIVVCGCP